MTEQDWNFPEGRFLSYALGPVEQDQPALFIVFNAAVETIEFALPTLDGVARWHVELDTALSPRDGEAFPVGAKLQAPARSVLVFSSAA